MVVLARHPHADIRFEGPVHLGPGFSLMIPRGGTFVVGPGVEFRRGFRAEVEPGGRISIGAGSVFTYYVLIQCTTSIDIGERCIFGQSTIVVDGQHRFRDLERPLLEQGYDYTPIRIEDDAIDHRQVHDHGRRRASGRSSAPTRWSRGRCRRTPSSSACRHARRLLRPAGREPPELARSS